MWSGNAVEILFMSCVENTAVKQTTRKKLLTPLRFGWLRSGNWWLEGPGHSAPVSFLLALGLLDGIAVPGWLYRLPVAGLGLVVFAVFLLGLHFLPVCLGGLLLTLACRPLLLPCSLVSLLLPAVLRLGLGSAAWCLFLFLLFLLAALLLIVPLFNSFGAAKRLIFPF